MDAPVTINSYQSKQFCATRFEAEKAPSFVTPTGKPTGKGKEDEAQPGRPLHFPPMSAPSGSPHSYQSLATPLPAQVWPPPSFTLRSGDFIEAFDNLTDEGFVAGMGY